ncbi:MAG: CRISPR-associated protein Cas4 [Nitrososphaerales archaeon]
MSSLDNFLHDPQDHSTLGAEDKEKFEKWVSRVLSDPSKISTMIEDALKRGMFSEWEAESANHKFRIGSYYPSIIERCLRQQAYSYLHPEAPSAEDLAIFGEGRAIHELIALALRRSGLISVEGSEIVVDLKFNEEAKLHGRIDDLLLIRFSGEEDFKLFVPLEIKSASSLPDEPKPAHYYQLSTYLLAENYPIGVLLYWVKRGGVVKAFPITKEDAMYSVLRERVLELHDALKKGAYPRKEASQNRDYLQCERCNYSEQCNPFLIDSIPKDSRISMFDIDSTILDTSQKKRAVLLELGLSPSMRVTDIHDEKTKEKYWKLLGSPRFVELDQLMERGRERVDEEIKLGRIPIGISPSRGEKVLEATKARLANLRIPLNHLIIRELGNYDTEPKFKVKWALRLSTNYDLKEYFDRDALTSTTIKKSVEESKLKKNQS